jgi:hypothetical protein
MPAAGVPQVCMEVMRTLGENNTRCETSLVASTDRVYILKGILRHIEIQRPKKCGLSGERFTSLGESDQTSVRWRRNRFIDWRRITYFTWLYSTCLVLVVYSPSLMVAFFLISFTSSKSTQSSWMLPPFSFCFFVSLSVFISALLSTGARGDAPCHIFANKSHLGANARQFHHGRRSWRNVSGVFFLENIDHLFNVFSLVVVKAHLSDVTVELLWSHLRYTLHVQATVGLHTPNRAEWKKDGGDLELWLSYTQDDYVPSWTR